MAYDRLKCYNNALRYVGEGKLGSLTENRGPRYLLDDVWDEDVILFALEQGQWQFATRAVQLDADTGIEPDFGLRYAFQKPDDYVRNVALSADEYFSEPFNDFADETNFFYADIDRLFLKYVSDDDDYGRNFALWTPSFFEYVSAYMAWKIVARITNSPTSREELEKIMKTCLGNAQGKDGVNRPTRYPSRGSWVHSRHGRNSAFNRERR